MTPEIMRKSLHLAKQVSQCVMVDTQERIVQHFKKKVAEKGQKAQSHFHTYPFYVDDVGQHPVLLVLFQYSPKVTSIIQTQYEPVCFLSPYQCMEYVIHVHSD